MIKAEATEIAHKWHIPLGQDFHTLPSEVVDRITSAADERKYRKPKDANGSRARYFYAMLNRANNSKVTRFIIQGNYGHGWEDESEYERASEARKDLKEYRIACPQGSHRLISRRVPA